MGSKHLPLSKKIVFIIAFVLLSLNIALYVTIIGLNKSTLYDMEREKAQLITKTYAPMLAMQIYLDMDDKINDLTKTSVFRRLRSIKQLGLSCLVYPGATHTRFEHSLGTFQVAHDYMRSLISRTGSIWIT